MASVSETRPTPPKLEFRHHVQQMLERAAQPVELINVDGVAWAQTGQQAVQFRACGGGARSFFREDSFAPGFVQGIELQFQILVAGRDASVAMFMR